MENKQYSYTDSSHVQHNVAICEDDLKLVHNDKRLHDVDLKGKTTTYFKDILHRFMKNKVSVFGFIIIALIVLLSAVASLAMPEYNITSSNATEIGLAPKIFAAGTGFWDGTVEKNNFIYDTENQIPVDIVTGEAINKQAYMADTAKFEYNSPITTASKFATDGGYMAIRSSESAYGSFSSMSVSFDFNNYDYSLTYSLTDEVTDHKEDSFNVTKPSYDIYLEYSDTNGSHSLTLVSQSQSYGEQTLDVKAKAIEQDSSLSGTTLSNAKLGFKVNAGSQNAIYVRSIDMTTTDSFFNSYFSFDSVNDMLLREATNTWLIYGNTSLYMATVTRVSFRYDTYEEAYGNEEGRLIGASNIKTLADSDALKLYTDAAKTQQVDLKNMTLDAFVNQFASKNGATVYFEILNEKEVPFIIDDNPITIVATSGIAGKTVQFKVTMTKWKELGYSSYPIHILGTDKNGYDLIKVVGTGTLYSLGMAIIVFIFCFIFGLIWGSISGYFGGAVDIIMERICEIIGGVPTMVLLTLFLVVFGKNWFIFIFGMCFSGWLGTASITRTQFYRYKRREYVLASRSLGATDSRLIFRHILPNGMGTIITSTVLMIPSIIYSEAGLAYLGLGFSDIMSLGRILSDNQAYLLTDPLLILWPSLIIALLMISFELFGQGLRDAFNPSTKGA